MNFTRRLTNKMADFEGKLSGEKRSFLTGQAELYIGDKEPAEGEISGLVQWDLKMGEMGKAQKYLNLARQYLARPPSDEAFRMHWASVVRKFNSRVEYFIDQGLETEPISHPELSHYSE